MKFEKYNDIENGYRERFINEIRKTVPSDEVFVALNKIDGSQFSFYVDDNEVRVSKRSCLINSKDNFNGSDKIFEKYHDRMKDLLEIVRENYRSYNLKFPYVIQSIVVDCEIFGGSYPHPEVERVQGAKVVQGRVFYTPFNDIAAYDLRIGYGINDGDFEYQYLPWDLAMRFLMMCDIPMTTTMASGTLDQMLNLNPEFLDPTYIRYKLPLIENNFSEGYVIKPLHQEYKTNHGERVIFKHKNPKFAEKSKKTKVKTEIEMSEEAQNYLDEIISHVSDSRFASVASKLTDEEKKNFSLLMKEMASDTLKDFGKDNPNWQDSISKAEEKNIMKTLNKAIATIVQKNW